MTGAGLCTTQEKISYRKIYGRGNNALRKKKFHTERFMEEETIMTPTPEQIEGYCQKGIAELNQVQAMTPTEAAAILRRYNEWRLGGPNYEYNSAEITEAIYVAIQVMEELGEPATGCNEIYDHVPDAGKMVPADLETIRREAFHAGREQKGEYNTNSGNYEFEPLYPTAGDYINSLRKEDEEC